MFIRDIFDIAIHPANIDARKGTFLWHW